MGLGGVALPDSVHSDGQVNLARLAAAEAATEFGVERLGDRAGDAPAEHGQVERPSRAHRRGGGGDVIGVAGDATGVEHQHPVDAPSPRHGGDLAGEHLLRDGGKTAVGMVTQVDVSNAEQRGGRAQLGDADLVQVAGHAAQRRCLPVGEAQHADLGAGIVEGVQQATQTERLVIGVGDDREDPSPGGQRVVCGDGGTHMVASSGLLEGQAGRGGVLELVVDRDGITAVGGEQRRGERGPIAAVAMHPYLSRGHLAEPI